MLRNSVRDQPDALFAINALKQRIDQDAKTGGEYIHHTFSDLRIHVYFPLKKKKPILH